MMVLEQLSYSLVFQQAERAQEQRRYHQSTHGLRCLHVHVSTVFKNIVDGQDVS